MGNIIIWIIGVLIIGYGIYQLVKGNKKKVNGGGCSGCSGCSSKKEKDCNH